MIGKSGLVVVERLGCHTLKPELFDITSQVHIEQLLLLLEVLSIEN